MPQRGALLGNKTQEEFCTKINFNPRYDTGSRGEVKKLIAS